MSSALPQMSNSHGHSHNPLQDYHAKLFAHLHSLLSASTARPSTSASTHPQENAVASSSRVSLPSDIPRAQEPSDHPAQRPRSPSPRHAQVPSSSFRADVVASHYSSSSQSPPFIESPEDPDLTARPISHPSPPRYPSSQYVPRTQSRLEEEDEDDDTPALVHHKHNTSSSRSGLTEDAVTSPPMTASPPSRPSSGGAGARAGAERDAANSASHVSVDSDHVIVGTGVEAEIKSREEEHKRAWASDGARVWRSVPVGFTLKLDSDKSTLSRRSSDESKDQNEKGEMMARIQADAKAAHLKIQNDAGGMTDLTALNPHVQVPVDAPNPSSEGRHFGAVKSELETRKPVVERTFSSVKNPRGSRNSKSPIGATFSSGVEATRPLDGDLAYKMGLSVATPPTPKSVPQIPVYGKAYTTTTTTTSPRPIIGARTKSDRSDIVAAPNTNVGPLAPNARAGLTMVSESQGGSTTTSPAMQSTSSFAVTSSFPVAASHARSKSDPMDENARTVSIEAAIAAGATAPIGAGAGAAGTSKVALKTKRQKTEDSLRDALVAEDQDEEYEARRNIRFKRRQVDLRKRIGVWADAVDVADITAPEIEPTPISPSVLTAQFRSYPLTASSLVPLDAVLTPAPNESISSSKPRPVQSFEAITAKSQSSSRHSSSRSKTKSHKEKSRVVDLSASVTSSGHSKSKSPRKVENEDAPRRPAMGPRKPSLKGSMFSFSTNLDATSRMRAIDALLGDMSLKGSTDSRNMASYAEPHGLDGDITPRKASLAIDHSEATAHSHDRPLFSSLQDSLNASHRLNHPVSESHSRDQSRTNEAYEEMLHKHGLRIGLDSVSVRTGTDDGLSHPRAHIFARSTRGDAHGHGYTTGDLASSKSPDQLEGLDIYSYASQTMSRPRSVRVEVRDGMPTPKPKGGEKMSYMEVEV